MSVMRTRGHGGDNGEPLGVNHQIRVIDVRVVNKQWAEHPSSGDWRSYEKDYISTFCFVEVLLEMEIWSLMVKWFGFYFCHFNNGFPEAAALATM